MKAIIIAEGRGDLAVLSNILKGALDIDLSDIKFQTPEYEYDQTDLFQMNATEFGGWNMVKKSCGTNEEIEIFLEFHDRSIFIVQIDSAERTEVGYEVLEPIKSESIDYCEIVKKNIALKINEWLNDKFTDKIAYAICVEEIESWLMTLLMLENTSKHNNPKNKYFFELNRKLTGKARNILSEKDVFKQYLKLSHEFSKKKYLEKYIKKNKSFEIFYDRLIELQ